MPKFNDRAEYEKWKAEQMGRGESGPDPEEEPPESERQGPAAGEKGPETPPPAAAGGSGKGGDGLPDVGELFGRAWEIFKVRFGVLIGLFLFTLSLVAVTIGVSAGSAFLLALTFPGLKALFSALWATVGIVTAGWIFFWGGASLTFAVVDERLGFGDALTRGRGRVCSFVWITTLMGFIITGGFLLLFFPGILFGVWFAFPLYIMAREDLRGMDALLKSREYVRDQWFPVFLRLFLIWILSLAVGAIPLAGILLSVAFVPYMMIYFNLLYQDLVSLKGKMSYVSSGGRKCGWIALGGLGYIVAPILIIVLIGATLLGTMMFIMGLISAQPDKLGDILRQEGIISVPPPAPASEIDGVWRLADKAEGDFQWRISGTDFEVTAHKGAEATRMKGRMVMRSDTDPREIDLMITEAANEQYLGKTSLGIYRIVQGTLTICSSEPGSPARPRSFSDSDGYKCFKLVRGQEAPPEAPPQSPPGGTGGTGRSSSGDGPLPAPAVTYQ